mmetsp:Transcript_117938/g.251895  ORF Transcript_117938/g.251895 Transcript_117938/m.251895 type:complete len:305 (-) Transcript_117938:53-967(-)
MAGSDAVDRPANRFVVVDTPAPFVRRLTFTNPGKKNALSQPLRSELYAELIVSDKDPGTRVTIIRGGGELFSAGYDLKEGNKAKDMPFYTSGGHVKGAAATFWPEHVVAGHFFMWDLAKPVIASVHGFCLAGGTELATACDLVYVAEDAQIGYPPTRSISPPDMQWQPWMLGFRQGMYYMLTGDSMTGIEAVKLGFANESVPLSELDAKVLEVAGRVAGVPSDLQMVNKRAVHRQMEAMGIRNGLRTGTELQALATYTRTTQKWLGSLVKQGLSKALSERDAEFGDYRTGKGGNDEAAGKRSKL